MGRKKKPEVSEKQLLTSLKTLAEDNEDIVKSGIDFNDAFLLAFLRGRKYNLNVAYETIQKYVHVRKRKYVEFFSQLTPESLMYMYDMPRFMAILKHRDPTTGCLVGVLRPNRVEIGALLRKPFEDVLACCTLAADELIYVDDAIKNGLILVASGEGFGMTHFREISPNRIKTALDIMFHAYPFKVKQVHVVQCSAFVNTTIKIVMPFIPRKIRKRMIIHNTLETFHEFFEPNVIPSWLGGNRREEEDWEVYDYYFDRAALDHTEYYETLAKKLAEGID
ncbi:Alpha-tocopherol transfer protein-like [Orchesella cincta]|uniref:Alpha-tocopherol transfer protein-like n=1 Tax=Orchesella cincta TaxID=48709 RepID=A0A1D2MHI8_ORCCI|nr:Alpha-tocopherol transfer protein-like [Orchesella cincta]